MDAKHSIIKGLHSVTFIFSGVMQQVDQAIEKEAEERRKNLLKKESKNINEEIKQVKVSYLTLYTIGYS